ncbi:MAG TPA: HigA family addiction module antitoxin [Acidiferrobacterales bacterium]
MSTTTEKYSRMHNPAHPGEVLREMYLKPLEVSVSRAARALGVTRKHLSNIVNGHATVTPDMALRLALAFRTDPELWVNMQVQYDLWMLSKQARPKVKSLVKRSA